MPLPTLFIGSSSEGKSIAGEIADQLRADAVVKVWDEGVFRLGESYLDSLRRSLNLFDFAFILSAGPLADDLDRGVMEQREIANFALTLGRLLHQPDAAEFADRVKIIRLAELQKGERV